MIITIITLTISVMLLLLAFTMMEDLYRTFKEVQKNNEFLSEILDTIIGDNNEE